MLTRNCPSCNKIMTYKSKKGYTSAEANSLCCISCAKSGNTPSEKHFPELWVRDCMTCSKRKIFKSYVTWYRSKKSMPEWKCKSCLHVGKPGRPHTEEHKKYMSEKMKNRKVTWNSKIADSHWSKNAEARKIITENHSAHMASLIAAGKITPGNNKGFKYGHYVSRFGEVEYYRSSYELKRMKELDEDVTVSHWTTKHRIVIAYVVDGINRRYIPDFKIVYNNGSVIIEEVKGYINDLRLHEAKVSAATQWAAHNGCSYTVNFMEKRMHDN